MIALQIITVDERGEKPIPQYVFITPCCGARMFIKPDACPMCGKKIDGVRKEKERKVDHCRFQAVSRYVS